VASLLQACYQQKSGWRCHVRHRSRTEHHPKGSQEWYFDVANTYGSVHEPAQTFWRWIRVLWNSSGPFGYTLAPVWQLLLVTVLLVAVVAAAARRRDGRDVPLLVWCIGVWFVPLLQPGQSLWRSEAALVLLMPLLARMPRPFAWAAAVALVAVGFALARGFFAGTLV